jgi:hypothetical protein
MWRLRPTSLLHWRPGNRSQPPNSRSDRKLGVTDKEIDKLRGAILKAPAGGPLDPDALRKKVGDAARNLGPEGTKKGLTTTLPVALGHLQAAGAIRPRTDEWAPRPAKLQVCGMEMQSEWNLYRSRAALFFVDRARAGG